MLGLERFTAFKIVEPVFERVFPPGIDVVLVEVFDGFAEYFENFAIRNAIKDHDSDLITDRSWEARHEAGASVAVSGFFFCGFPWRVGWFDPVAVFRFECCRRFELGVFEFVSHGT